MWIHGGSNKNIVYKMLGRDASQLTGITPSEYWKGWLLNSEGVEDPNYEKMNDLCEKTSKSETCGNDPIESFDKWFKKV